MKLNKNAILLLLFVVGAAVFIFQSEVDNRRAVYEIDRLLIDNPVVWQTTAFNSADGGGAFIQSHLGRMSQSERQLIYRRRFGGN